MAKKKLGVFDSGVGGVTVLHEILKTRCFDDIIYFGDTGRVPYGTRSAETILQYARQDVRFLLNQQVDEIVIACGTVSAIALEQLQKEFSLPIIGVIDAAIDAAAAATRNGRIGVIGTKATVSNGAYEAKIKAVSPNATVVSAACPLFVPLVEYGFTDPDNEITKLACLQYLAPIIGAGCDTLIMGCTHYPMIAPIIRSCFEEVTLINVGTALAVKLAAGSAPIADYCPTVRYFVSDDVIDFRQSAALFMGDNGDLNITKIDIQKY